MGKRKDRIRRLGQVDNIWSLLRCGNEGQGESTKIPTFLIRVSENVSDVMKRNRNVRQGVPSEKMTEAVLEFSSWRPAGCWTHGTGARRKFMVSEEEKVTASGGCVHWDGPQKQAEEKGEERKELESRKNTQREHRELGEPGREGFTEEPRSVTGKGWHVRKASWEGQLWEVWESSFSA